MAGPSEQTLRAVIRHYGLWRERREEERGWWMADGLPLDEAVYRAARSVTANGRKHGHQKRIPPRVLRRCAELLSERSELFAACKSFDQVMLLVQALIGDVDRAGEMVVYDTADRIAARLGLPPTQVYLHAGTREGARALGIDVRGRRSIHPSELPAPLSSAAAGELEDMLCIYKGVFAGLRSIPRDDEMTCTPGGSGVC